MGSFEPQRSYKHGSYKTNSVYEIGKKEWDEIVTIHWLIFRIIFNFSDSHPIFFSATLFTWRQ